MKLAYLFPRCMLHVTSLGMAVRARTNLMSDLQRVPPHDHRISHKRPRTTLTGNRTRKTFSQSS